jgi:RNA polymerase sigma factor (sigma-70 family)
MSSEDPITQWIMALKEGKPDAAQRLWQHYFRRLVGLARLRLHDLPRGAGDEEDVALSAFDSFYRGVLSGRFPRLDDRHDLWRVLVRITVLKALDLRAHEGRATRGGGRLRSLSELTDDEIISLCGDGPGPEMAAQLAEEFRRRIETLADPTLRAVAIAKLEGYTNDEIGEQLGCSTPTVERKLQRIRNLWEQDRAS